MPKKLFNIPTFIVVVLLLGGTGVHFAQAVVPDSVAQEQTDLESELAELEEEIEDLTKIVQTTQQERTTLERDIAILDAKKKKVELKIRAHNLQISKLSTNITDHSVKIDDLTEKISREKESVSELIRQTNEKDSVSFVEIILGHDQISDFFVDLNSFVEIQESLQISLENVKKTKGITEVEKGKLQGEKQEQLRFKEEQSIEKKEVESFTSEKEKILKITQGEEEKYQSILKETKKTAAEIRNRILRLVGDVELTFGEAVKIAEIAEKSTGVRAALILAVLSQESSINGIIGRNIGRCYYNTPSDNGSGTVMSDRQKPSFLEIIEGLGLNPNTVPVSCPIKSDGAYGGAMGPAQFMPTTWWDIKTGFGYKKRIAKLTGNNPPSPFTNGDAFTGTALYLKDAYSSNACQNYGEKYKNVLPQEYLLERCTAAKYYAGNNWWAHRLGYGDRVAERAIQFQKDINILNQ